jgi:hypothetical protein
MKVMPKVGKVKRMTAQELRDLMTSMRKYPKDKYEWWTMAPRFQRILATLEHYEGCPFPTNYLEDDDESGPALAVTAVAVDKDGKRAEGGEVVTIS